MGITGLSGFPPLLTGTSTSVHLQMDELNAIRELPSVENAMPLIMYYTDSTLKGEKSDSLVWGSTQAPSRSFPWSCFTAG